MRTEERVETEVDNECHECRQRFNKQYEYCGAEVQKEVNHD